MDLLSIWDDTSETPRASGARVELAALLDDITQEFAATRSAIPQHPDNTSFYEVIADGSFFQGANVAGTAALISSPGSEEFDQKTIHKLKGKQTSVSAEIMAAVHGLQAIPPGSSVRIHSDCQAVCKAIKLCMQMNVDDFISFNAKIRNRSERFAWGQLYSAVMNHKEVVSSYIDPFDTKMQAQLSRADGFAKGAAKASTSEMLAYEKKQARKQIKRDKGETRLAPVTGRGSRSQRARADIENSKSEYAFAPAA